MRIFKNMSTVSHDGKGTRVSEAVGLRRQHERIEAARGAAARVQEFLERGGESDFVKLDVDGETVEVPREAVEALADALVELGEGVAVCVVPMHLPLTTQQVAELLHVSRPTVVQLIDSGELEGHRVGTHRRVWVRDAIAYKRSLDAERWAGMAELMDVDD